MSARRGEHGFTLVEALASVAIMAAILTGLATLAGQWLPSWRHGFATLEGADLIGLALDRVVEDISSAEYARLDGATDGGPLFRGERDTIVFVRSSVEPGAGPKLEVVRIAERPTPQGPELQRARASFTPGAIGSFRDAVALLRAPFRLVFAYAGPDGQWRPSWSGLKLPRAVRLTVQAQNGLTIASTAFALKITKAPEIAAQPQDSDASATPQPAKSP